MDARSQAVGRRITFLVSSPDATGGIARSVNNLANHLVTTRPVRILGLRRREKPGYAFDPRIGIQCVTDDSPRLALKLDRVPSRLGATARRQGHSALTDMLLPRALRRLEPGVVVSTRPLLQVAAARYAPAHTTVIGQDHFNFQFRQGGETFQHVAEAMDKTAALVVLTEADAADYRQALPEVADKITVIRNAAPWPLRDVSTSPEPIIVAAGSLVRRKGFDRLIEAFAPIALTHPEWRLRILGEGPEKVSLRRLVADFGVRGSVSIEGRTTQMEAAFAEASVFALTSRLEGLPMVVIEALTSAVPVVSFDCPRGPRELVIDRVNGRLVPDGDVAALTSALLALIDDPAERQRMATGALQSAEQYQPASVVASWTQLFERVHTASAG